MDERYILERDPIFHLLLEKLKWSNNRSVLVMCALASFLLFGLGGFASWSYQGSGKRILELSNLSLILVMALFFTPLTWGGYIWQGKTLPRVFANLIDNGIFGEVDSKNRRLATKSIHRLFARISNPRMYIIVILLLGLYWLNMYMFSWPQQIRMRTEYWYEVKWYFPFHIFAFSISFFALIAAALRQVSFVYGLLKLFGETNVYVKLFHPDEVGGFGEVGKVIQISTLFGIGVGFTAAIITLQVHLTGINVLSRTDLLAIYLCYLLLTPICLLIPFFSLRSAMIRCREAALSPLSNDLQESVESLKSRISEATTKDIKDINERIEHLQKQRDTIIQGHATSPIPIRTFRSFSISAIVPLITGVASLVSQFLTKDVPVTIP